MKTYIAYLRGINVGGRKKIKMADLRHVLGNGNFQEINTYIQSGNLVFKSEDLDKTALEKRIHTLILNHFGFDVPVLILELDELQKVLDKNPFAGKPDKKNLYYVLLKTKPEVDKVHDFNKEKFEHESFFIAEKCVYLCCRAGYGKAKLSNTLIERKLKVHATARNFKTMHKLLEMAKEA